MNNHHPRRIVVATVAFVALATGCGSDDRAATDGADRAATCRGVEGPQSLDGPAEKMISLSSSFTEMVYAMDASDHLFAVDTYSDYPAEAAAKEPRLDGFSPNVEVIAGYEPDLVLISYDPGSLKEQLCGLGIAVWEEPEAATLEDIYVQIGAIGELTGHPENADELTARMRSDIAEAVESAKADGKTYYFEIDTTNYAFTSYSYQGELLKLFGMKSIADEGASKGMGSQQMNVESIIAADPDVIFLGDTKYEMQSMATIAARPGWAEMSAVRDGRVIELDDDIVSRWGPRVVDLAWAIAAGLETTDDE